MPSWLTKEEWQRLQDSRAESDALTRMAPLAQLNEEVNKLPTEPARPPAPAQIPIVDQPPAPQFPTLDLNQLMERSSTGQDIPSAGGTSPLPATPTAPAAGMGLAPTLDLDQLMAETVPEPPAPVSPYSGAITALGGTSEAEALTKPSGTAYVAPGASPALVSPATAGSKEQIIQSAGQKYGVRPDIFLKQLTQEGALNPDVWAGQRASSAGARGPGQFMPATAAGVAKQLGVTLDQFWADPALQVEGAALHMRDLLQANGGDYAKALAAYNAGQGAVDKYGGVPPFQETQNYVSIILGKDRPVEQAGANAARVPAPGQSVSYDFDRITKQWEGVPYVFGGAAGRSVRGQIAPTDCSGFLAELTGLPAHTDAAYTQLKNQGLAVERSKAQPGDIVFWMGPGSGGTITYHTGLYAGNDQVVDMSGGGVKKRPITHAGTEVEIFRNPNAGTPAPSEIAKVPPPDIKPVGVAEEFPTEEPPTKAQINWWSMLPMNTEPANVGGPEPMVKGVPLSQAMAMEDTYAQVGSGGPPVRDDYATDPNRAGAVGLSETPPALADPSVEGAPGPALAPSTGGYVGTDQFAIPPTSTARHTPAPLARDFAGDYATAPAPQEPEPDPLQRVVGGLRDFVTSLIQGPSRTDMAGAARDIQARQAEAAAPPGTAQGESFESLLAQPSPLASAPRLVPRGPITGSWPRPSIPPPRSEREGPERLEPNRQQAAEEFTRDLIRQQSGVDTTTGVTPLLRDPGEVAADVLGAIAPTPNNEIMRASRGEAVNPLAYSIELGYAIADTLPDEIKRQPVRIGVPGAQAEFSQITGRDLAAALFEPANLPSGPLDAAGTLVLGAVARGMGASGVRALTRKLTQAGRSDIARIVAEQAPGVTPAARLTNPMGSESDWWERTYGAMPKASAEAQRIEAPLERLLEQSAAASPDGLAHPTPEQLKEFAVPKTQKGDPRPFPEGDPIPIPTTLDDLRRARDVGTSIGADTWYADFHNDIAQTVGRGNQNEGDALFVSFSAVLDPISAKQLTLATMARARETGGFANMSRDEIKDSVLDFIRAQNNGKALYVLPVHFQNVEALYQAGERAIDAPKLSNFMSDFLSGRIGYIRDPQSTNDVWMQRGQGYKAWSETGKQKLAQWEETYRYGNTLTRWLAREVSQSPEEAQAAMWTAIQTAALPNNPSMFAYTRRLNADQADAFRAAEPTWKQVAKDFKAGTITLGQAIDTLEPLGVYQFTTPGSLRGVNEHPLTQKMVQAFQAGNYAAEPMPGPSGRIGRGLHYPGAKSAPWTGVGAENIATSPLALREGASAAQITLDAGDPGRSFFMHDFPVPHRVTTIGDVDSATVSFPSLNHAHAPLVGQALADETGTPVRVVRAPLKGEEPNALLLTIPRTATDDAVALVGDLRGSLDTKVVVQYDGQIIRILAPDIALADDVARGVTATIERYGIDPAAISARGRYAETIEPSAGRAGASGGAGERPDRPGGGRASDLFRRAYETALGRSVGAPAAISSGTTPPQGVAAPSVTARLARPDEFIALRNRNERAAFMSPLTPDQLHGSKPVVLGSEESGFAGYVLTSDGDIQNVFNVPGQGGAKTPGLGARAVLDAIEHGGRTLDAYDGYLPDYYHQFGFEEVGRVPFNRDYAPPNWDYAKYGEPDVVLMARRGYHPGDTPDAIIERILAGRDQWRKPVSAERFPDWDGAAAARERFLAGADRGRGRVAGISSEGQGAGVRPAPPAVDIGPGTAGGRTGLGGQASQGVAAGITGGAPSERYYHGTGSDFARPEAGQFDPNGLFGPGYYVTSDPRVAGGTFDDAGKELDRGYSGQRATSGMNVEGTQDQIAEIKATLEQTRQRAAQGDQRAIRELPWEEKNLADHEQRLARYVEEGRHESGPNIRPVDVPRNLRLLDADAPVPEGFIDQIRSVLSDMPQRDEFERALNGLKVSRPDPANPQRWRGVIDPDMSAEHVYHAIPGDHAFRNKLLAWELGYDGIKYGGGQRIPMTDEAGKAIEHNAVVIFPESLDKIRNAASGQMGGFTDTPIAGQLARQSAASVARGAVGGGLAAGYEESQLEGSTPESILSAGAAGAVEGSVLALSRRLAPGRLNASALSAAARQAAAKTESWQRVRSTFDEDEAPSIFKDPGELFRRVRTDTVKGWFDSTVPLREAVEGVEDRIGRKLLPHENAWLHLRLLPGVDRATKQIIEHRLTDAVEGLDDEFYATFNDWLAIQDAKAKGAIVEGRVYRESMAGKIDPESGQKITDATEARYNELIGNNPELQRARLNLRDAERRVARETRMQSAPSADAYDALRAAQAQHDRIYVQVEGEATRQGIRFGQHLEDVNARYEQRVEDTAQARAENVRKNRQYGQFTIEVAEQAERDMRRLLTGEELAELEKRSNVIRDFNTHLRTRMRDSGLISKELFEQWERDYPLYTPIRFIPWQDAAEGSMRTGASLSVADNGLKRLTDLGADYERELPIEALHNQAYEIERRAYKNDGAKKFLELFRMDPDGIGQMIRPANDAAADWLGVDVPRMGKIRPNEKTFAMWENGVKHEFRIDRDLEDAWKRESFNPDGKVFQAARALGSVFRATATSANMLFLFTNAMGDGVTAGIRGVSPEYLKKGYEAAITKSKDYEDFIAHFGGYSGFLEQGAAKSTIRELRGPINNLDQLRQWAQWANPLHTAQEVGETVEMAPRIGRFMQLRDAGVDPYEAALAGRDITIDFARGGLHSRAINAFVPFFNVGLQAPAQVVRFFQHAAPGEVKPGQAEALMRVGTFVVAPTIGLEIYNQTHDSYKDVPSYDKDRGLVIMDPRGPGPVDPDTGRPTPRYGLLAMREWTPFAIATRELMNRKVKSPEEWGELAARMSQYMSPIALDEGFQGLVPPWITVTMEQKADYDFFRRRPIAGEYLKERLPEEQYTERTSETAKALGRLTGKPPVMIEHAVKGYFTGVGQQALAAGDMILRATGRAEKAEPSGRVGDIPLVGGVAGRFYREQGGQLNRDEMDRANREWDEMMRRYGLRGTEIQKPTRVIKNTPLNSAEYVDYFRTFNSYLDQELNDIDLDSADDPAAEARKAATRARAQAQAEMLDRIDTSDIDERLQRRAAAR